MATKSTTFRTFRVLLAFLLLFNVFDGLLTLFFLQKRIAEEFNPLMDWTIAKSAILFMSVKIGWIGFNLFLLWKGRKSLWAHIGAKILFVVFTCLFVYECVYLVLWLFQ